MEAGMSPAQYFLYEPPSDTRKCRWECRFIRLPNDCITAIIPGVSSLPSTVLKYLTSASFPQRQRPERSERLYLKNILMTWRTKSANFAWKGQQSFRSTVRTSNSCKSTLRIATVKVLLNDFLNNRTKIAVLSLKSIFILQEKSIEIMKKHSIENSTFRMTLSVYSCHSSRDVSRNRPELRLTDILPWKWPSLIHTFYAKMSTEVNLGGIVQSTNVHCFNKNEDSFSQPPLVVPGVLLGVASHIPDKGQVQKARSFTIVPVSRSA